MVKELLVLETNDSISQLFEFFCPGFVPVRLRIVNTPINFYNEATGSAVEISNKPSQGPLPVKF